MTPKKSTKRKNPAKRTASRGVNKRRKIKAPRTHEQYLALPDSAQETWNRVAHVIAKMRSEGKSLTQASRDFGLDPRAVRSRAGNALRKTKSGRYVARRSDKLLRLLVIPSSEGLKEVAVRDSRTASTIAAYSDAVHRFLQTGDQSSLRKFKRLRINDAAGNRIKLLTEVRELMQLGSAGVLSFESLYARVA